MTKAKRNSKKSTLFSRLTGFYAIMMSYNLQKPIEEEVIVGEGELSISHIVAVARRNAPVRLSDAPAFYDRVNGSRLRFQAALESGAVIYGVTTGFGGSCGNRIDAPTAETLARNMLRYHGCGTGAPLSLEESRAAMFCRLLCFARGYSGVSWELLEALRDFLNAGISPIIPSEGSVGASGDLTPSSYIAAALTGEREVYYKGAVMPAAKAIAEAGLSPYKLKPKEALGLVNGTSVMTGIAALVLHRAENILKAGIKSSAMAVHALSGNIYHYLPAIFETKPFPGQRSAADEIRALLGAPESLALNASPEALQDPYSIRCAPHVFGVLADALEWAGKWTEIEANSANDNPLFDPKTGSPLMGGNFYGGHITMAMDSLKAALASVCDLLDRQLAILVDPRFNRGLSANLVGTNGATLKLNHGFKGMQITASALTAEALKAAIPAGIFSRSTESHNQDKVSLGTIASRDAARICELSERVAAVHLLAAAQACELRGGLEKRPKIKELVEKTRKISEFVSEDRPLEKDIERAAKAINEGEI